MPSIRLIIADAALREAVAEQIRFAGGLSLCDGKEAPDAIVADEAALAAKELEALREASARGTPLLVLGGENPDDIATESLPKPLRLGHLLERLRFYLEVAPRLRSAPIAIGPYRLEAQNRRLVSPATGATIRLTGKETMLLAFLSQSPAPVLREDLLAAVWGYDGRIDTHTLETHIYQLRRKLDPGGDAPPLLVNEQGAYRLVKE